jgi:transcriptional regulator with XRE-family HTH domain
MMSLNTGEKIKSLRKSQKLTQAELAFKVGIVPNYLSLIETNRCEATLHIYRCIADALHIHMWHLFCDLPKEALLILDEIGDCTDVEAQALRRLISGNKIALRQHYKLDLGM